MKRPSGWSLAMGGMAVILVGLALASVLKGASDPVDTTPAPPCPFGFVDNVGDAERIREQLRAVPEGAELLGALRREVRFCFGTIDVPVVTEGRLLVLDARASVPEQAARVGHLLHHVTEGMPFPDDVPADADCDAILETAIEREAEAYALEVRLRQAVDLDPDRYEFEPAARRASGRAQVALVERYLREHPSGAPNMDPLIAGYRQRCEVERAEAGSASSP
ncbi:MAG: hypothetical protein H6719_34960 [Sandaracinaceae bacterium]|nr:hypothetical protein [Sandaracinaceae bacterium]